MNFFERDYQITNEKIMKGQNYSNKGVCVREGGNEVSKAHNCDTLMSKSAIGSTIFYDSNIIDHCYLIMLIFLYNRSNEV